MLKSLVVYPAKTIYLGKVEVVRDGLPIIVEWAFQKKTDDNGNVLYFPIAFDTTKDAEKKQLSLRGAEYHHMKEATLRPIVKETKGLPSLVTQAQVSGVLQKVNSQSSNSNKAA